MLWIPAISLLAASESPVPVEIPLRRSRIKALVSTVTLSHVRQPNAWGWSWFFCGLSLLMVCMGCSSGDSDPPAAEPASSSRAASDDTDKEWMDGMRMGEPLDPAVESTPAPDGTPRYSVEFVRFPITDFVAFMSHRIEQQIKLSDAVAKRADEFAVTLTAKNEPVEAIFEQSLSPIGLRARQVDQIWMIENVSTPGSDTDK